jgi:hypothetical protein
MPGNNPFLLLLLLGWAPSVLTAQQTPITSRDMEDLMYTNETVVDPETLLQAYEGSGDHILDLNSASPEALRASGLLTPYQLHHLLIYREKYGEIYSLFELAVLPGFDSTKVEEIRSCVKLNTSQTSPGKKPLRHMVLINMGKSFPVSEAYQGYHSAGAVPLYAGTPLKTCVRIRSQAWSHVALALTYEKDAGEPFLYRKRPQFLSAYLAYKGEGSLRHLVLGNYKLNQGLGLVNGAGFFHRPGNLRVDLQSLSRIRPYASKTESMYEQGLACQLEIKKLQLLMWASYRKINLSPVAFTENPGADRWLEYQRTSGLFRSEGELEGRELAYRIHTGIQALYKHRQLGIGIMSGSEWVYPTKKAMAFLEKKPGPVLHQNISLHGNWYKREIQIFGELSASGNRSLAFLFGTAYHFNDFILGSLLVHHYGTGYRGSLPASYGSGSKIRNEQGLALHLHIETGKFISADLTGELFRYPSPRYLTKVPSGGYRLDLSLQNPGTKTIQWRVRVVSKTWQTTPSSETSKLRPLEDFRLTRLDGHIIYNYKDLFKWQSRILASYYDRQTSLGPGYAAMQQLSLQPFPELKIIVQFVHFNVSDWENRIYLYQPGFYYSFSFPAYYGHGQKTTFLLTLKPLKKTTLSAKISGILKSGKRDWEGGIQLRLNF